MALKKKLKNLFLPILIKRDFFLNFVEFQVEMCRNFSRQKSSKINKIFKIVN